MTQAILWAMAGTGFTFFMTSMGSATVFFFKKRLVHPSSESFWDLLQG